MESQHIFGSISKLKNKQILLFNLGDFYCHPESTFSLCLHRRTWREQGDTNDFSKIRLIFKRWAWKYFLSEYKKLKLIIYISINVIKINHKTGIWLRNNSFPVFCKKNLSFLVKMRHSFSRSHFLWISILWEKKIDLQLLFWCEFMNKLLNNNPTHTFVHMYS